MLGRLGLGSEVPTLGPPAPEVALCLLCFRRRGRRSASSTKGRLSCGVKERHFLPANKGTVFKIRGWRSVDRWVLSLMRKYYRRDDKCVVKTAIVHDLCDGNRCRGCWPRFRLGLDVSVCWSTAQQLYF
ncbi:hypothetical protein GEV33_008297 [Tenebrio molitor]|uniref:Uncharacterized protein n=1 Tax=Tenebrio molitor TaxID=7067 RepID=A0A8J6LCD4_TENMO|nr:hypothetical protein GEV33_008297 [Tenebrio molitor]